jgi:hypothetical protein
VVLSASLVETHLETHPALAPCLLGGEAADEGQLEPVPLECVVYAHQPDQQPSQLNQAPYHVVDKVWEEEPSNAKSYPQNNVDAEGSNIQQK